MLIAEANAAARKMRRSQTERGEKGMGFSQTDTVHHFFLNSSGGVIQVEAKDPADISDRNNIRMHLKHIAKGFEIRYL